MKIKEGCSVSTSDFWYDISMGGYLKPNDILEEEKDIEKVNEAIKILLEFQNSCEQKIDGFYQ